MTRTRQQGFTLVELMTAVVIIGVLAALAIISIGRNQRTGDIDKFASDVRNTMSTARKRAITTRAEYMVEITETSVQYCQVTNVGVNKQAIANVVDQAINWQVVPTACAQVPVGSEASATLPAGLGAHAAAWAQDVDEGQQPPKLALPAHLYFNADGSVFSKVNNGVPLPTGFTLYVEGTTESGLKRKLLVYGFGGRAKITDTW